MATEQPTPDSTANIAPTADVNLEGGATQTQDSKKTEEVQDNAFDYEKGYKEIQSEFTKRSQENARLKAQVEALTAKAKAGELRAPDLTKEQQDELDDLKYKDPDAWRVKINELENSGRQVIDGILQEVTKDAEVVARKQTDEEIIKDFVKKNPDITLEYLQNEVPYSLRKSYEDGKIDTGSFLAEAAKFKKAVKVTDNPATIDTINLGSQSGAQSVSSQAAQAQSNQAYENFTI